MRFNSISMRGFEKLDEWQKLDHRKICKKAFSHLVDLIFDDRNFLEPRTSLFFGLKEQEQKRWPFLGGNVEIFFGLKVVSGFQATVRREQVQ